MSKKEIYSDNQINMKKRVLLSLVAIISIFSLQSCVTNYVVSTPTKYKSSTKLDKINTFELDPIEVLKKRKNLKILKVLNLMLTLNLDKTIKKDDIESYNEYKDKFLENELLTKKVTFASISICNAKTSSGRESPKP